MCVKMRNNDIGYKRIFCNSNMYYYKYVFAGVVSLIILSTTYFIQYPPDVLLLTDDHTNIPAAEIGHLRFVY